MDRATLERLAREAGLHVVGGVVFDVSVGSLSRFAMFVAEECATLVDNNCAAAIRAGFGLGGLDKQPDSC